MRQPFDHTATIMTQKEEIHRLQREIERLKRERVDMESERDELLRRIANMRRMR